MFIAKFVIAKSGKQPLCPSAAARVKKMWRLHRAQHGFAINQENSGITCRKVDAPETIELGEIIRHKSLNITQ